MGILRAVAVLAVASLASTTLVDGAAADTRTSDVTATWLPGGIISLNVHDESGVEGTVRLGLENGTFTSISVQSRTPGTQVSEVFHVTDFAMLGGDTFRAELRGTRSGNRVTLDPSRVQQQALPALVILGALARVGLSWVIRWYGRTQVKKAAKSFLLNNISASRWTHIMAPKHRWSTVGARSREQVAELMARAMAEGRHVAYGNSAKKAIWNYRGRTIEVTYSRATGHISNGWVR